MSKTDDIFAHCSVCSAPIRNGEVAVAIVRNVEEISPDGSAVQVTDSEALAHLCASCGHRYNADAVRIAFDEKQSG